MMTNSEEDPLSFDFSSLLSNIYATSGFERLFGIAFVFTVETGFIPTSLAEYYDSTNSNVKLARMIKSHPINSFWCQNDNIFNSQLFMSNQLCNLTGIPAGDSLIVTLSYSNISKCTILDTSICDFKKRSFFNSYLKFKNIVSVPIKCAVLETITGQYPNLCGLPEELILYIMIKLEPHNLYVLMQSCKLMNDIAINNQLLWKKFATKELNNVKTDQRNELEEPITDWRNFYYQLKKKNSTRRRTIILR